MDLTAFLKQMWQKKVTVIIITVFVFLLTIAITLTQPLKYSVTTKLLVVQNYSNGTDAYGIARSNQYLSNVLAQVVYSDAFYDNVMNSGFNISANNFPTNDVERRKFWLEMIDSRAIGDTGMIEIVTYHQDKRFADQVNRSIAYILQTKNNEYHGLGDKVRVKVIDNSLGSVWPVKPNILLNAIFGLFLGLVLSACYIKLWPDNEIVITQKTEPKFEPRKGIANPDFETVKVAEVPFIKETKIENIQKVAQVQQPPVQQPPVQQPPVQQPPVQQPPVQQPPAVPVNLPVSGQAYHSASVSSEIEAKKFDGDISNIMK